MHKYIIMGVQGCGKGTQARLLHQAYDLVHINVGDIFRWNIQNRTKLGARIQRIVASGALVSDDIVDEIVKRRLDEHNWNFGFVLDGFPRSQTQAMFLLERYNMSAVIHVQVPDRVVVERIMGRRLCANCGIDYNIIQHSPKVPDRCDVCGGQLVKRVDDTLEAVETRLSEYHAKTRPVLDQLGKSIRRVEVDGTQTPDRVQADIRQKLGLDAVPQKAPV